MIEIIKQGTNRSVRIIKDDDSIKLMFQREPNIPGEYVSFWSGEAVDFETLLLVKEAIGELEELL